MKKSIAFLLMASISVAANAKGPLEVGEMAVTVYADISDSGGSQSTTIAAGLDAAVTDAITAGGSISISESAGTTSTTMTGRARYHFAIQADVVPYAGGGLSMFSSSNTNDTGLTIEAGVLVPLAENADVDVNYNTTSYSNYTNTSLNAGIRVTF